MPDVTASYGRPFDFITLFGHFHTLLLTIHDWIVVSPPNFHWLYVWLMYTFWYVNVTASYGRFSDLIAFSGNFHILQITACLKRYNFIKLLHFVSWGRSVEMKSKPITYVVNYGYVSLFLWNRICFLNYLVYKRFILKLKYKVMNT